MKKEYDFSNGERGRFANPEGEFRLTKTTKYDAADYLKTPEEITAYLEACIEEANGDEALIAKAYKNVARVKINAKRS